jgi:hypothetical protein
LSTLKSASPLSLLSERSISSLAVTVGGDWTVVFCGGVHPCPDPDELIRAIVPVDLGRIPSWRKV